MFVTSQIVYWTMVIVNVAQILVVAVLGIPGNVLSAAVFYIQGLRERINLCVFSHAVVNLVVLLALFLISAEYIHRYTIRPSYVLFPYTSCESFSVTIDIIQESVGIADIFAEGRELLS